MRRSDVVTTEITAQVARFYDAESEVYDRKRYESAFGRRKDQFHRQLVTELIDEPQTRNGRVLEIGVGTGRLITHFAKLGFDVTGLDVSEKMIAKCRERLSSSGFGDVPLYLGYSHFDERKQTFAGIYSIFVVNLIPSFDEFCGRAASLLDRHGVLVFNVPTLNSIFAPVGLYVNARRKTVTKNRTGYRHSRWFSRGELIETLGRWGFSVERLAGQPPWCGMLGRCQPLAGNGFQSFFARSLFVKARRVSDK